MPPPDADSNTQQRLSNAAMLNRLVDRAPGFNANVLTFLNSMVVPGSADPGGLDDPTLVAHFATGSVLAKRRAIADALRSYRGGDPYLVGDPYPFDEMLSRSVVLRRCQRLYDGTLTCHSGTDIVMVTDRVLWNIHGWSGSSSRWVRPIYMDPAGNASHFAMTIESVEEALYGIVISWAARNAPRTPVVVMAIASGLGALQSTYGYMNGNVWGSRPTASNRWTVAYYQFGGPRCVYLNMVKAYTDDDSRPITMIDRNCDDVIPVIMRRMARFSVDSRSTWIRNPHFHDRALTYVYSSVTGMEPSPSRLAALKAMVSARVEGRSLGDGQSPNVII